MKRLSVIFFMAFFLATNVGYSKEKKRSPKYDINTVVTVTGKITKIRNGDKDSKRKSSKRKDSKRKDSKRKSKWKRYSVSMTSAGTKYFVEMGSARNMKKQNIKLVVGDTITVTGSKVKARKNRCLIIAAEVKKGDVILKLRSSDGKRLGKKRSKKQYKIDIHKKRSP